MEHCINLFLKIKKNKLERLKRLSFCEVGKEYPQQERTTQKKPQTNKQQNFPL